MGKIVIPKNSASLEEVMGAIQIYYDAGDWLSNADFIQTYKNRIGIIGDDTDSSAYTKKTEIGCYYGFLEWEDITRKQSPRRITPRGRAFLEHYNAKDKDAVFEDIMCSLEEVTFGRNNFACQSCDSDIEPPALFLRAMLDMGYLTNTEFAYLVYRMEYEGYHYTETIDEILRLRENDGKIDLPDEAKKFSDPKPIVIMERWGVLTSSEKGRTISNDFLEKYRNRLKNLKIYNIDKNVISEISADNDEPNIEDNEKKFRLWLSNQRTASGKLCSPSAISNNCSALNKVCHLMEIVEYPDLKSIFEIADIDTFVDVKNIILFHPDYEEVNLACNNRFLSTGLKWYEKYLNELYSKDDIQKPNEYAVDENLRVKGGTNIILYGVPGAGKSWTIKHEYCDDDSLMERVVFHPDYTYSDFVGQILPSIGDDGSVSYEFSAGPFTKLVRKAYINPDKMFYLIIEEVNRGNAPAIFGDIFQLLDRDKDGNSEYEITNADIAKIVYLSDDHKVSIPSNISILCTMNTSDQNVFTLDTAFQRRWNMRLIKNKFRDEENEKKFASTKILDTDVTWEHFFTEINKIILAKNIRMTSSEDKRLGTHFVSEEDLTFVARDERQISRFPEKVLKYLWDDAFKFTKEDIFDLEKVKSLEDVIDMFTEASGNARFLVFKENIYNTIVPKKEA